MRPIEPFVIAGVALRSRLLIGTGKFPSPAVMARAIEASQTQVVTVALRRVDIASPTDPTLSAIDLSKVRLLPNTSGARDAEEAVRLARLARAAAGTVAESNNAETSEKVSVRIMAMSLTRKH